MNVAVIGAGATGLTAAWELAKAGHQVTILEGNDQVGGLAAGFRLSQWEWWLDKFYHHWFASDTDILRLIEEIGCASKIIFNKPRLKTWIGSNFYDMSISLRALQLPISFPGKLRLALAGFYLKLPQRWQSLDHLSAYDWLHRTMGCEVYRKIWSPLLEGKFKDTYREVPLSWLWAHIYNRSSVIAVYDGGSQAVWETFAQLLMARGVKILLKTPIHKLSIQNHSPALLIHGQTIQFDAVISTLSPQIMLEIAPALAETDYAKQMLALKNVGAVCLVLALKQPLFEDGTYSVTLPAQSCFPFINIYEHTNLVSSDYYGGDHLVYCVDFVSPHHAAFRLSNAQVSAQFINALPRLNPAFSPDWIRDAWVFKSPAGQPVPQLNGGKQLPSIKTPLPGVYWTNMGQMHPWGKGTTFAVRLGKQAADLVLHDIPSALE